jgi:hypothetical protein
VRAADFMRTTRERHSETGNSDKKKKDVRRGRRTGIRKK